MNLSFENKVALVTGAGSGMGLATTKAFAEARASGNNIGGAEVTLTSDRFRQMSNGERSRT